MRLTPLYPLFPYTTLFRSTPSDFLVMFLLLAAANLPLFNQINYAKIAVQSAILLYGIEYILRRGSGTVWAVRDRKSTRLNSSHVKISYAVFCLKKKKNKT